MKFDNSLNPQPLGKQPGDATEGSEQSAPGSLVAHASTEHSCADYAICIEGLTKLYGTKVAVDQLTLRVPRGSFFGFLGPNGAGKTTTIKILMGLAEATSGTVMMLGQKMDIHSVNLRKKIGVVLDDSLLFDRLTGQEYLQFVGRIYGLERRVVEHRVAELLDLFELTAARHKMIADYSKGMKKRVAMGAALIHRPEIFLMDEPFEGVDAVGARLMKEILLDRVQQGCTVFLTSHVLEVVERLCERLAIIHEGRLVLEGTMAELREGGGSADTLEEIFVRTVGGEASPERLEWL
ncbi:MAG: ABC transporter ATP-binding protein [Bryobacterales bacterium]|nr:ABC transporter ATP-binding protein [Bryobacterales bacterium]